MWTSLRYFALGGEVGKYEVDAYLSGLMPLVAGDGPDGGDPVELAAGSLIDIDIRAVNADRNTVGELPMSLDPGRELPRSVPPTLMSFGDRHHRCPGAPIAIMETEVFVRALLRRDVVAEGPPTVQWNPVTQGYDLDRFRIRLRS